ncbi:MAG: glycosyl hydrolase [Syntrophothermus sp.]
MSAFRRTALLFLLFVLFMSGCKENSTDNQPDNSPKKSPKRGIAYNLTQAKDLDTLKNYLSWWYNWAYTTSAPADYYKTYNMEFIPMLWGGNTSAYDMQSAKNYILAHPEIKYLLVLNEPNLKDQANRTPEQAVADWAKYEGMVEDLEKSGRTIYLVGPQMNWGTMTGYSDPVIWLDDFYKAYQNTLRRDPRIDYLAFHWYDYGLSGQLDRLKKYGKKIWITEMANWNPAINSYTKQMQQMKEMVAICESRDDVFRYAWFIGRGSGIDSKYTNLFNASPGELSELGKYYISLPYNK